MARTEDWFGLAGVAWLSGLLEIAALRRRSTSSCRAPARSPLVAMPADRRRALSRCRTGSRCGRRSLSYLLVARHRRRLAAHRATTAGCAGGWSRSSGCGRCCTGCGRSAIVIGVVAVVGLALDRAPPRACSSGPPRCPCASRGRRRAARPSGPRSTPASPRSARAPQYFAEWGPPDWSTRDRRAGACCSG